MIKKVIIEIPKNSNIKYEYDSERKRIVLDRVLYGANHYPQNYGFFENTLDWDGDPLDALVIADHSIFPGVEVEVRVLGSMHMIDGGETDTKLITVINSDKRFAHINNLKDVPQHLLDEIKDFFQTYKNLQKKSVHVGKFSDLKEAEKEFKECEALYKKYHKVDKDAFIAKMKKMHPEKYK